MGGIPSLVGGIAQGAMSLMGGIYAANRQAEANRENLAFAREQMDAQLKQQQWANEQYIESRDYSRVLQQQVFDREDTKFQRGVADAVAAGFSPLAALGNIGGSAPVVSSSSAPGNMVSGNQASQHAVGDLGLSSAGAAIATALENKTARDHQLLMEDVRLANELKRMGEGHGYNLIMQKVIEGAEIKAEERQFSRDIYFLSQNQSFARSMAEAAQAFQKDMTEDAQQHAKDMHQLNIDTASQQDSALARLASSSSPEVVSKILRATDNEVANRVADFIDENPEYSYMVADLIRSVEELPVTINNYAAAATPLEGTTPPSSRGVYSPGGRYYYDYQNDLNF